MSNDFQYNRQAQEFDDRLEEVMDTHQAEKAAEAEKEMAALETEPPILDKLMAPSTKDEVQQVSERSKSASEALRDVMIRERLHKVASKSHTLVDNFLQTAKGR